MRFAPAWHVVCVNFPCNDVPATKVCPDKTWADQQWRHVEQLTNNPLSTTMPSSFKCFTVRIPHKTSLCGSQAYSTLTRKVCGILRVWMACILRGLIPGVYLHPRLPCQRHNASTFAAVTALMSPASWKAGAQRLPTLICARVQQCQGTLDNTLTVNEDDVFNKR